MEEEGIFIDKSTSANLSWGLYVDKGELLFSSDEGEEHVHLFHSSESS